MGRKVIIDHVRKIHKGVEDEKYDVKDAHFKEDDVIYHSLQRTGVAPIIENGVLQPNGVKVEETAEDQKPLLKTWYICPGCSFRTASSPQWLEHQCPLNKSLQSFKTQKRKKQQAKNNNMQERGGEEEEEEKEDEEFTIVKDEEQEQLGFDLLPAGVIINPNGTSSKRFACPYCVGR